MNFEQLLELVGSEPVFESALLLAGNVDPAMVYLQLSRWTAAGRLHQLRRGLYALAPPFQKVRPHPFVIANHLAPASYVSCQSALAHYGLIPETVPVTTSVTTGRPASRQTPLGNYEFHHIKPALLRGYQQLDLGHSQTAFVAQPEKALCDLLYLQPGSGSPAYLAELRLQNLERLDPEALRGEAGHFPGRKLQQAAERVLALAQAEAREYELL